MSAIVMAPYHPICFLLVLFFVNRILKIGLENNAGILVKLNQLPAKDNRTFVI